MSATIENVRANFHYLHAFGAAAEQLNVAAPNGAQLIAYEVQAITIMHDHEPGTPGHFAALGCRDAVREYMTNGSA